ncbi:MAG: RNA-binding transcriptional accessory protein, partial [Clostridia bacterium]|nr:RNA-binding transcriptional accessory protein [Clostridia bacterium]
MGVDIFRVVTGETGIPLEKVKNTMQLLDAGNTVPFIARYRKEVTGELDENQIRLIEERVRFHRGLEERKGEIIRLIDEQGKLTGELKEKIMQAVTPTELEDLYLPYRPKRRTRAGIARGHGLEPLALYLLSFPREGIPEEEAGKYIGDGVPDEAAALHGAMDIVAEMAAEDAETRKWVREFTWRQGTLTAKAKDPEKDTVYRIYYDNYREPIRKIVPHRVLAINRGEREEFLRVSVEVNEEPILNWLNKRYVKEGITADYVREAVADAY